MRGERGKTQQDPRTGTIEDETALDTVCATRRRDDVSLNRCVRISISVSNRD